MKFITIMLAALTALAPNIVLASALTTQAYPLTINQGIDYVEDFIGQPSGATGAIGQFLITNASTATAVVSGAKNGSSNMGTLELTLGVLRLANTVANANVAGVRLGGGQALYETVLKVSALSDSTDEYVVDIGLCDSASITECVDGVWFRYDRTVSVNWLKCTASNSTAACSSTGIAVAADTWTKLKFLVSATGVRADFYVDGVSGGALTANIPTGSSRETGLEARMYRTAGGSTSRLTYIDYIKFRYLFTTAR